MKYKTNNKLNEFVAFLRKRLPKKAKKVSDEQIIESYQLCSGCEKELFSDEELSKILDVSTSPKDTLRRIDRLLLNHQVETYLEETDEPKELVHKEETWRLGEKYPSVIITLEIRELVATKIAERYIDWLKNDELFLVDHENDPDYDCSGEVIEVNIGFGDKMQMFDVMGEWWCNAHTGMSTPTYESGHGFEHEIYGEEVWDIAFETLEEIWNKKSPGLLEKIANEDEKSFDTTCEQISELILEIGDMSIVEVLTKHWRQ